jgi:hypothetical protein
MEILLTSFILLQGIVLVFMLFHDWISIYPLNDIKALNAKNSKLEILFATIINSFFVIIPLFLTIYYGSVSSNFIKISIFLFYFGLTIGTILSWWVPYLKGSSDWHKKEFEIFKNTHHFLPARSDNVIPNTLHVILHVLIWSCLTLSVFFMKDLL